MAGIITTKGKNRELLQQFYSPNLLLKTSYEEYENLYCFIAKIEPWDDENTPPTPLNSDYYLKQIYKNILVYKKINSNDIAPVIERIDWTSGTIYSEYSDSIDMCELNSSGKLVRKFYVRNSYDQVFKCLSNATNSINPNGVASTVMPIIDFSITSASELIQTADGYKWQYLFSLDYGSKIKFFDENWMPLIVDTNRKNLYNTTTKGGEISTINVYNSGNNYIDDTGLNITTAITISGDGTGANASAIISGGKVTDIIIDNYGSNYSYATVTITPKSNYSGNGAILVPSISPIGGHGYNLLSELGCYSVMVTTEFDSNENNNISDSIDYRQIGLVSNIMVNNGSNYEFANSYIYASTHVVNVSPGSDSFQADELVYQGLSLNTANFTGRIVNFDSESGILYLINTTGTLNENELIKGASSNAIRVVLNSVVDDILLYSGDIVYIENRKKVQRSPSGLEQFRLVLQY